MTGLHSPMRLNVIDIHSMSRECALFPPFLIWWAITQVERHHSSRYCDDGGLNDYFIMGDSGYVSLLKNNLSLPSDKTRIQGTIVVYNIAMKPH